MDDLVKRLRADDGTLAGLIEAARQAADRIEELEATLQRERAMGVLLAIDGELYGDMQKTV